MRIKKLPAEARSKLQSGLIITDAVQCVLELVHNSLDAEATGVAVRIDLKAYQIRVIDNGKGIRKEDFELVGEKFMTSKYDSFHRMDSTFPTYGFKGQALSSLLDVCKSLTIETKSEENGPTFVKVFHNNKASAITEVNSERSGTGTTVTVEDFMCTMPVRRKRICEIFDIEEMKSQLQYLAIMHYNVCFTLRNENKGIILLQTPQASSVLDAIKNIFGKTVAKSLQALYYKEKKYEITGFISLKPQIQNRVQLLYINRRIITKGVTHKFINNVIKEYVGKYNMSADSPTAQILKGLKDYCRNIFILEIRCPHSQYELFTNMRKSTVEFRNWKDVLRCLHKAVKRAFKGSLNLDSSSNIEENDENIENEVRKYKRRFGTSVLINAVQGVPVKRELINKKSQRRKKKKILDDIPGKADIHQSQNKKPVNQLLNDSNQKEISRDSLESPIPKKHLRGAKSNSELRDRTTFNQSFLEFYEWVKGKLETDKNANNLYNDFLQFKIGENARSNARSTLATGVPEFKSPVLGGKLKRKKVESPKKLKEKQGRRRSRLDCASALNKETAFLTRQQQKIFPYGRLRMEKAIEFSTEVENDFPENFNFEPVEAERESAFAKSFQLPRLNEFPRPVEYNQALPSLPSSEVQLTNIIQFRNWSQDFLQRSSDNNKDVPHEYTFRPASGTWASHYQENVPRGVEFQRQNTVTIGPLHGADLIHNKNNIEDLSFRSIQTNGNLDECATMKQADAFHDVEIQVNMSKVLLQKTNVIVQTSPTDSLISESSYFKSGSVNKQKIWKAEVRNALQSRASNVNEEIPNPDFWNSFSHDCSDDLEQSCDAHELNKNTPAPALINEKNSTSSEFLCGQKSNSVTRPQNEGSESKETQTLAAIWADSLTEAMNKHTDSNSKSESTLPKTIPVEEIDCNILHPIESGFRLTERHDIIPKGLSPTFFNTGTGRTFTLSPSEKHKLKLTVESAQSDFLSVVKWQDESTGDYVKPTIPERVLDEMREKAGKNAMSFENAVLSGSLSYCAVKVHSLLHSFTFTKELLSDVEVLGQLDKKFIVTIMKLSMPKKMELISLFDQHAVDERIKLEELLKDYSSSDGELISCPLKPPVECLLKESDVRVLSGLSEKLLKIGVNLEVVNKSTVSVKEIPTFLFNKHEKDLKNKKDVPLSNVLQALITSLVDEMRETRGAFSKIPKVMHNTFCHEACQKAIKFNRVLSLEDMTEMINKLRGCKFPFQCAHGRPSVIPIIDLEDFHPMMEKNENNESKKILKSFLTRQLGNLDSQ